MSRSWLAALNPRPHSDLLIRILLASAGAYALSALFAASLSLLPWLPRAQMVLTATMLAFVLYCAVVIGIFHARSAGRAAAGCLLLALPMLLLLWWGGSR